MITEGSQAVGQGLVLITRMAKAPNQPARWKDGIDLQIRETRCMSKKTGCEWRVDLAHKHHHVTVVISNSGILCNYP